MFQRRHLSWTAKPDHARSVPATVLFLLLVTGTIFAGCRKAPPPGDAPQSGRGSGDTSGAGNVADGGLWITRAEAVTTLFHRVYTPCWEGAYGAIGDAYLFAATGDSSLLRFHLVEHDLTRMCEGTWVDDRAWVCLAELCAVAQPVPSVTLFE